MPLVYVMFTPHTAATRYHVPNMKILQVETTLKLTQEDQDTPLVESYNQQQISIWLKNNLNLPLVQVQVYTEWNLL